MKEILECIVVHRFTYTFSRVWTRTFPKQSSIIYLPVLKMNECAEKNAYLLNNDYTNYLKLRMRLNVYLNYSFAN